MADKKLSIFDLYERNTEVEESGQWVRLTKGDIEVQVRSTSSDTYQRALERLQKPYLPMIRRQALPEDIARNILFRSISQGLLVNWRNVFDKEGKEIPFSEQTAFEILSRISMRDVADEILEAARMRETFTNEHFEDSEKN